MELVNGQVKITVEGVNAKAALIMLNAGTQFVTDKLPDAVPETKVEIATPEQVPPVPAVNRVANRMNGR